MSTANDSTTNQYLTFRLQDEEFGLEILRVQEIKGISRITPIPNSPPYVKGVINLRGAVVPIFDLRSRFGMPATEYNRFTVIIVLTVGTRILGLVVDAVSDVLNILAEDIEPIPDMGGAFQASFMTGVAKTSDRLVTLLDVERLVAADHMTPTTAS